MRIGVVCSGFSSILGGLETVYKNLCRLWTENGHEVFVVSGTGSVPGSGEYKVLRIPFVSRKFFEQSHLITKISPLESYELEGLSCAAFVALRLIELRPDIVVSCTRFETVAPLKLGFPCVMISQAVIQNRLKIFEKVDRVIVNDSQSNKRLKALGIKTELILNGVGIQAIQKIDVQKLRVKHAIPNGSIVILTVARLYLFKRVHLLIDAFNLMRQPAILIIVGDGPELPSLKKQALRCNPRNKVIFLKHVPQRELDEFYQLCDVFTLPSLEAFGIVFLEALSFGKMVVTNPSPEKKFILGKFGVFTNVEDPTEYSRALLRAVSVKIDVNSADYKQHMQKFNWNNIALQYLKVFQDVLQKRALKTVTEKQNSLREERNNLLEAQTIVD